MYIIFVITSTTTATTRLTTGDDDHVVCIPQNTERMSIVHRSNEGERRECDMCNEMCLRKWTTRINTLNAPKDLKAACSCRKQRTLWHHNTHTLFIHSSSSSSFASSVFYSYNLPLSHSTEIPSKSYVTKDYWFSRWECHFSVANHDNFNPIRILISKQKSTWIKNWLPFSISCNWASRNAETFPRSRCNLYILCWEITYLCFILGKPVFWGQWPVCTE